MSCILYMGKVAEKGFKMASMMNKLAMMNNCEIILENIINFFCQKSLWNSGAHYTCMRIILNKICYRICWPAGLAQWLTSSLIHPRLRVRVLPLLAQVEKWLKIAFLSGFIHYASTLFRSVISKRVCRYRDRHLINSIEITGKLFTGIMF